MSDLPEPIYDTLDELLEHSTAPDWMDRNDYQITKEFLLSYRGSEDTFNSYRKEVDRFLQWLYIKSKKTLSETDKNDIENYIRFCSNPPSEWTSSRKHTRFLLENGVRVPNPSWRPFHARKSKVDHAKGKATSLAKYELSDSGKKAMLRILSSYFSYLEMEDYTDQNPVKRIRQKSQFIRTRSGPDPIRRLSPLQWESVLNVCKDACEKDEAYERDLFILTCLYSMYLRISELAASTHHSPKMNDFYKDQYGCWWFKTVGKGNKEREITVSDDLLESLKRYRSHLDLSELPNPSDNTPLIARHKGAGAIQSTRQIRHLVQVYFDKAKNQLISEGLHHEADEMAAATTHWLRHTGISDDIKHRPKEHVRDDAGHSSSSITDKYIDVEKRERHLSGRNKKNIPD